MQTEQKHVNTTLDTEIKSAENECNTTIMSSKNEINYNSLDINDLENEEWRDVPKFEGLYEVSNYGRIKGLNCNWQSKPKINILKGGIITCGYRQVLLYKNKGRKAYLVHRLVGAAFISNPNSLPAINHKDGNKLNNHVSNLEWITNSRNRFHAFEIGLCKQETGENNPNSKYTKETVLAVRKAYKKEIFGFTKVSRLFNIPRRTVEKMIKKITWPDL